MKEKKLINFTPIGILNYLQINIKEINLKTYFKDNNRSVHFFITDRWLNKCKKPFLFNMQTNQNPNHLSKAVEATQRFRYTY